MRRLGLVVLVLSVALTVRLFLVALQTDNWPGFWYSSAHILVVALGTYLALREDKTRKNE